MFNEKCKIPAQLVRHTALEVHPHPHSVAAPVSQLPFSGSGLHKNTFWLLFSGGIPVRTYIGRFCLKFT